MNCHLGYTISLIVILLSIITSCEKDLETDIKISPKLCFNCILNPDSIIKGSLSLSNSISSMSEIQKVDGATVELKKDGKVLGILTNRGNGIYSLNDKPVVGSYYEVNIKKTSYPHLTATTIIPEKPVISFDESAPRPDLGLGTNSVTVYDVTYTIFDKLGVNRYWTYSKSKFSGKWHFFGGYGGMDSPCFDNFNKDIDATYENGFLYKYYLRINDSGFEGKEFSFKDIHYSTQIVESFFLDVDEHYDKYLKSTIKQKMNNEDNILFNEPVQIYTNIKNGLGIFGSVAITTINL